MTGQIDDRVRHRRFEWDLVEIDGEMLFSPEQHGLAPRGLTTACWRGWWCEYRVDSALWLTALHLGVGEHASAPERIRALPPLRESRPQLATQPLGPHAVYRGIDLPLAFTGALLLGRERDPPHDGLGPPWYGYERAEVLTFESGRLVAERDARPELEACRARYDAFEFPPSPPDDADEAAQLAWIRVSRAQYGRVSSFFRSCAER